MIAKFYLIPMFTFDIGAVLCIKIPFNVLVSIMSMYPLNFVTVYLVEQDMLTLLEYLSNPQVLVEFHIAQSLDFSVMLSWLLFVFPSMFFFLAMVSSCFIVDLSLWIALFFYYISTYTVVTVIQTAIPYKIQIVSSIWLVNE